MNRSIEARNSLIENHLSLAEGIVKSHFSDRSVNVRRAGGEEAFVSEAYLGLLKAAENWKGDVPFEKVASRYVYLYCLTLLNRSGLIKIPHSQTGQKPSESQRRMRVVHSLSEGDEQQIEDHRRNQKGIEAHDELETLLSNLPEEDREVVRVHMIEGQPPKNRHTRKHMKRVFARLEELAAGR